MLEMYLAKFVRIVLFCGLCIYMYGATLLKYIAGAESLVKAVSFLIYNEMDRLEEEMPFDPYIIAVAIFSTLSLSFCFGNIENSKNLQIVTTSIKFLAIFIMMGTSIYSLFVHGVGTQKTIKVFDFSEIETIFGNAIFIYLFHHSISGIIYPVRPQTKVKPVMFYSLLLGCILLVVESSLASFAFGGYTQKCDQFPCEIQELYNENFLAVPFVGTFCNFYPMLNVAAVPILTITLRNNLMKIFNLENEGVSIINQNESNMKKGILAIIISIPIIILSLIIRDPQQLIAYTGGLTGVIVLVILPCVLVLRARMRDTASIHPGFVNFNKSYFQSKVWTGFAFVMAVLTWVTVISGLIKNKGGGH